MQSSCKDESRNINIMIDCAQLKALEWKETVEISKDKRQLTNQWLQGVCWLFLHAGPVMLDCDSRINSRMIQIFEWNFTVCGIETVYFPLCRVYRYILA